MIGWVQTLWQAGLVGLAGAMGALARYAVSVFVASRSGTRFPWGTLYINISGALVIGFLAGLAARKVLSLPLQTVLATGFLGGYTTFSTFTWEGMQLWRGGNHRQSLLYLGGNVVPGLLAAALGLVLGGWL